MLELRDVAYRYAGTRRRVLEHIDLVVADGEILGVTGPNESGKSTLCLVASGLAPASIGGDLRGAVEVDGQPLHGLAAAELAGRTGIVFADPESQRTGVTASVFEEVAFGPVNLGLPVAESVARARTALATVGLTGLAERHPARLSGGETQLLAVASILALRPRVLVLDEPVAELDQEGRSRVATAIRAAAEVGTAIVVAEHDMAFLAAIGARIVAIERGRLVS
jgi:energy-coupling factor transporter ATP-binding protein EcfA2